MLQKGLQISVGSITILDFHLALATSKAVVEVTAEPPIVETERGSESNTITQNYIEDLPINRRDYLNFTLLLPGVSDSTRITDDQDFRVKQTPQSGLVVLWKQWARKQCDGRRRRNWNGFAEACALP